MPWQSKHISSLDWTRSMTPYGLEEKKNNNNVLVYDVKNVQYVMLSFNRQQNPALFYCER